VKKINERKEINPIIKIKVHAFKKESSPYV